MPELTNLELATQFVAALYAKTNGRPRQFGRIGDCASRADIRAARDIDRAVHAAEVAGLLIVNAAGTHAALTAKGCLQALK